MAHLATLGGLDYLTFTTAGIAVLLNLLVHPRAHLVHLNHSSLSFAGFASGHLGSALPAAALACSCSFMGNFDEFSIVALFESDLKGSFDGFGLGFLGGTTPRASPASSEKHI